MSNNIIITNPAPTTIKVSRKEEIVVKKVTSGIPRFGVTEINGLYNDVDLLAGNDIVITNNLVNGSITIDNSSTLDTVTSRGDSTSNSVTFGDITTTGKINGPSNFTIDPGGDNIAAGELRILGNLTVDGTTTTVNSTEVTINDKNILLGDSITSPSLLNGAGITFGNDSAFSPGVAPSIIWAYATDEFIFNRDVDINSHLSVESADIQSLTVSDLTDNRIVVAGTGGLLEDDANFVFDGAEFNIGRGNFTVEQATGNTRIEGALEVDDSAVIGNINIFGTTIQSLSGSTLTINPWPLGDSGELVIKGNLRVDGNTTTVNSTEVTINDKSIVLGDSAQNRTDLQGGGFQIGDSAAWDSVVPPKLQWDDAQDRFDFNRDLRVNNQIYADGIDLDSAQIGQINIFGTTIQSTSGTTLVINPFPLGDSGELVVKGNLRVDGTTTTVNSTEVSFNDKNIVLGDSAQAASDLNGAGITIGTDSLFAADGSVDSYAPTVLYNYSTDMFIVNRGFAADFIDGGTF